MMNTTTALRLTAHAAELIRLAATYQAEYGRGYPLKPGSSQHAWDLYEAIMAEQVAIAEQLTPKALEDPRVVHLKWWERQDVLDLITANELMQEISRLIASCAYIEAQSGSTDWSYAVFCSQAVIVGMLHPASRQLALGNQEALYAG